MELSNDGTYTYPASMVSINYLPEKGLIWRDATLGGGWPRTQTRNNDALAMYNEMMKTCGTCRA